MKKPIKKEDFLRQKEPINSPGTNIHGTYVVHGHDICFNEDISEYYSSINCGVLLDNSFDKGISLCAPLENVDGYYVGQWKMVCPPDLKLGQIMDRMPFGIIDKTITGLGATTLELTSQIRNSIIVVPTKALAYNKHIQINAEHNGLTMYVGSKYGRIANDTSLNDVALYLVNRKDSVRKFLTVADSLPKLLGYLEELGEKVYEEYFLMIDEIDTMQIDSCYRPRLENVIDYYFKFDFMNRAMVSATVQPFSNPSLEKEGRLLLKWEKTPSRNIKLVATNYVDDAAVNVILNILETTTDKILVAYNSLDGIFNIVKTLGLKGCDYGVLCSNRSSDKVTELDEDATNAIDENGHLTKRVTFMTCAYFAGIDIMDSCHLISISSNNQPFTYLSLAKLSQIAGRCRSGNLSEYIIYDVNDNNADFIHADVNEYTNSLLSRADKYIQFLNTMVSMAKSDRALYPMLDFVKSYISFIGKSKASRYDYPLSIVRENSITHEFVPSYFNIDALTDRWKIVNQLYSSEDALYNALVSQGHNVKNEPPLYIPKEEHLTENIHQIKELAKERLNNQFKLLKTRLLSWYNDQNEYHLEEIIRDTNKRLQDNVALPFKVLHPFIDAESLLNGLGQHFNHDRKLRNYINAAVFYALPNEHPFKASILMTFEVDVKSGESQTKYDLSTRHKKLREVFATTLNYQLDLESVVLSDLLSSFFIWARGAAGNRITGLNPEKFPPLISKMKIDANLLSLLRWPK